MPDNKPNPLLGLTPASVNTRAKRPNAKPGAVNFVPKEFDAAIEDQGCYVRITPSILCPNQTAPEDNNHALDCPFCYGQRTIDLCDKGYETWAFIQSMNLEKQFNVQGTFDLKDAKVSFKTGVRVSYWYKIEVLDFTSIFNQMIIKSSGNRDALRYKPIAGCDTPYLCIDSKGNRYGLNEDYKVGQDEQTIVWLTARRPDAGTVFSISYPMLPTFRVIELLHDNRYYYTGFKSTVKTPINMPQEAAIRLDFFAKNSGSNLLPVP